VRGISLGVRPGECFGLLGPNGAGKTTTLGCLTGEIRPPTQGEVFIAGHDATGAGAAAAYRHLGYCPQVDPLIPQLSGLAQLAFFCRLKGVPAAAAQTEAARVLHRLGFSPEDGAKRADTYSGGMKRKLSLGIALVGGSSILFLDEPSAAVDAAAKRHLWRVIKRRAAEQTVVITTHSMEEAEALCDRLAIQVRGELRCLGSPIHIKGRYGSGYQLEVHFEQLGGADDQGREKRVTEFIRQELSGGAELLESHSGRVVYQLPSLHKGGPTLGRVFIVLQASRRELGIAEYTLTQPSLEQVFLRFAKEQEDGGAPRPAEK